MLQWWDSLSQALAGQDIGFNLSDIEPVLILWRAMDLQLVQQVPNHLRRERLVECSCDTCIEEVIL